MSQLNENIQFTGKALQSPLEFAGQSFDSYLPDAELVEAVNLAIFLNRPLLLTGEPGCGKTRLAEAVAVELCKDIYETHQLDEVYFKWYIKSDTKARDGLYHYDAIKRLREAQLAALRYKNSEEVPPEEDKESIREKYISLGELGKAFAQSTKDKRTVLLIDEIDKADIDFPNDLLLELDKAEFVIDETEETVKAKHPPIVIITSNNEKELPSAFLRRCIYHHITYPTPEQLVAILKSNFKPHDEALLEKAVEVFGQIRKEMELKLTAADKKVSTSELIDWYKVINRYFYAGMKVGELSISEALDKSLANLNQNHRANIPFAQVLFKNWEAHMQLMERL